MNTYLRLALTICLAVVISTSNSYAESTDKLVFGQDVKKSKNTTAYEKDMKKLYSIPFVKKWEEMRRNNKEKKLLKETIYSEDIKKSAASLVWLKDLILEKGETNYNYPLMLAVQLYRANYMFGDDQKKIIALGMAYYSSLLLMTDGSRCDDRGVSTDLKRSLAKKLGPVYKITETLSLDEKERAINTALNLERKYKDREKQPDICKDGDNYLIRTVKGKYEKEKHLIKKTNNSKDKSPDTKIIMMDLEPSDEAEILYVSDSEWHKRRKKIRAQFQRNIRAANEDLAKIEEKNKNTFSIPYVKEWEERRVSTTPEEGKLSGEILDLQDKEKLFTSLRWLKNILLEKGETDYVYPLTFALQVHRMGYMSDDEEAKIFALAMSNYSKILYLTDAKRCDDTHVIEPLFSILRKKLSPVDKATEELSSAAKQRSLDITIDLERKNKNREKNPKICKAGMNYRQRISQNRKENSDAEIFYVSDKEWQDRREKIIEKFKQLFSKTSTNTILSQPKDNKQNIAKKDLRGNYDIPYVKKWEKMRLNDEGNKLRSEILTLQDAKMVVESLRWLEDAIMGKRETNYIYPLMHASQIHRIGYSGGKESAKVSALAMIQYARLLLTIDALRCDDNGVGTSAMFTMMRSLKPVLEEVKGLPYDKRKKAVNIALKLEENHKNRAKRPDICESGVKYMGRAIKNNNTTEEVTKVKNSTHTNIQAGSGEEIFYISDAEWNKKRKKLRKNFRNSVKDTKK